MNDSGSALGSGEARGPAGEGQATHAHTRTQDFGDFALLILECEFFEEQVHPHHLRIEVATLHHDPLAPMCINPGIGMQAYAAQRACSTQFPRVRFSGTCGKRFNGRSYRTNEYS